MQNIYETYYWQNSKVRLRAVNLEDSANFHTEDLDSEAWNMVHSEVVLPAVKPEAVEAVQNENAPAFAIENLAGEYIGHIHFNYINERHGTFSVGVVIWRKFRNNGYGKAAMELLLDYGFNERRLNKFNGFCLESNEASKRMMLSLGCIQEGQVREEIFLNGKFHDRILFGLTVSEYSSRRRGE